MNSRRLALLRIGSLCVLSGCSPVTVLNKLAPGDTYVRTADIVYGPDPSLMLDVYQPADKPANAPVVVFFYGGSWDSGKRADYLFVGEALASRGIVTVIADYRLYPQVHYPDFLKDCAQAMAWTFREIARFGGNPKKIFVTGHSAGAYNAAMIAFDDRWLNAVGLKPAQLAGFVGMAGPYNFLPITAEDVKLVFDWPSTPLDSQPINHIGPNEIPSFLIAAENDRFVYPSQNTEPLAQRLRGERNEVTVKIYTGVSHTTLVGAMSRPLRGLAPVADDFAAWVKAH